MIYLKLQIFQTFLFFQKLYQCGIKFQITSKNTQQHNKSKLKNTYRIKEQCSATSYV